MTSASSTVTCRRSPSGAIDAGVLANEDRSAPLRVSAIGAAKKRDPHSAQNFASRELVVPHC
jgi:hypothetical protein